MTFKPCPFCGNTDIKIISEYTEHVIGRAIDLHMWAQCSHCGARSKKCLIDTGIPGEGFSKTAIECENPKIVYAVWNRRVSK